MQGFFLERIMGDVGSQSRAAMNCIYRTSLDLQFQAEGYNTFESLVVTVVKRFKRFTSAAILLVQWPSNNEKAILKLADRRLGYCSGKGVPVPWSPSLEDHLQHAVRDIQEGVAPNWFELICDDENRPDVELWEDWMWEVSTSYRATVLNLLHTNFCADCNANTFRLFGIVRLRITSESTTLHPITDIVLGLVLEYIPGISMAKLESGVDVSQQAERISSQVMEAPRAIEAENGVLHNDMHIGNVVLRDENRSPVVIDFRQADIREPELSDEEWSSVVRGGPDTRRVRNLLVNPEDGPWKRTVTPYEMSDPHYKDHLAFNEYTESMPEDFRMVTFERVLDTDWEGAREKMCQWRIRPGVRCRPIYD